MEAIFLPILSLVLPFVALFLEKLFPLGFFIEEALKGILVFVIPKHSDKKLLIAVFIGVAFALTETVIYSTSIMLVGGGAGLVIKRLIFTSLLHSTTSFVIGLSILKTKKTFPIGLIVAILIHYLYNQSQIPL